MKTGRCWNCTSARTTDRAAARNLAAAIREVPQAHGTGAIRADALSGLKAQLLLTRVPPRASPAAAHGPLPRSAARACRPRQLTSSAARHMFQSLWPSRTSEAAATVEHHTQRSHEAGEATVPEREAMRPAAAQIEPAEAEPPVLNEPALDDDIVHQCGLESFPASDPPSWWAQAGSS